MSEPDAAAAAEPAGGTPPADAAIDYDGPSLARGGTPGGPGEEADPVIEPPAKTGEEAASDAGKELNERKRTLVGDLQAERAARKAAEDTVKQQNAVMDSWRPLLARLEGRPDLQQAMVDGRITITQAETMKERDDQKDLREIAEDFGFYEADGVTPDLARATRQRDRTAKMSRAAVDPVLQPIQAQTLEGKAMARVTQAVEYAKTQGDADPEIVREELTAWARKNPQALLDNDTGNLLYDRAVARTVREKGGTRNITPDRIKPEPDFVHTEAAGGKRDSAPKLTDAEKAIGKQYGLTEADWARADRHVSSNRGYTNLEADE